MQHRGDQETLDDQPREALQGRHGSAVMWRWRPASAVPYDDPAVTIPKRPRHTIPQPSFAATLAFCLGLLLFAAAPIDGAEWPDEYRAGQFVCHADFPLAPIHSLIDSMPALQDDLIRMLGIDLSSQPIHMFLFEQKATYQAYVKYYFPSAPTRKALFIKERGMCMVFAYRGDDFQVDLRHESTHALMNAALPMVPLWLDEGLAEYFEIAAGERAGSNPHMSMVKWGARFGQVPDLDELEELRSVNQMARGEYRHAWAWVHFLLHGPPEAREELQRYLADIQALTPPGQLGNRLRRRLPDLESQFAEHFKQW